jgi:16S rRNA (guanine966-N2)-methyltransferase
MMREAVFSILGGDLEGMIFWDLFCGTGAMGLEALSCGAAKSVFVDSNQANLTSIIQFLEKHMSRQCGEALRRTLPGDVTGFSGPPGAVFLDPPYGASEVYSWIGSLQWEGICAPGAVIMAEAGGPGALSGWEKRRYGSSWLFIKRV